MQYLSIDTTTSNLKLAVFNTQNNKTDILVKDVGRKQSEFLHTCLQELLNRNNLKVENIDNIIVNIGPGSYTSLRLGIATAKGLSLPFGIKITPVNSFDIYQNLYAKNLKDYVILIKNTEKLIYIQQNNKQEVLETNYLTNINKNIPIIGNGIDFYSDLGLLNEKNTINDAQEIAAMDLIEYVIKNNIKDSDDVQPLYLRPLEYVKTNPINK